MKIMGSNSFLLAAQSATSGTNDSKNAMIKAFTNRTSLNSANLQQAARMMTEEISAARTGYEMSGENTDLSLIWQRARDWGLGEQSKMATHARNVAVRASNEATLTDAQRKIMNKEISAMQAETTRIGLTNNIHGSHTLARFEETQEIEEIEQLVEVEENTITEIKPRIDVLWVVDRSGSMSDDIAHIKEDAEKMFKALEDKGFDVRMAIESFEISLDSNGSTDFRSDAASFQADVDKVLGNIAGGIEKGLVSLDQAMARFGDKFDPNATKVTVMLSDEYSDDFFDVVGYAKTSQTQQGAGAEELRQSVADALISAGSELYVVGVNETSMPDKDYTDVIDKVGKGAAFNMDKQGVWVDKVTENFIASVEKDIEEGKFQIVITEKIISSSRELLGDWDMYFQTGPDAKDLIVERFKTSTAETSGLSKADASSAEKARESIDIIDNALGFLNSNRIQVGVLKNNFTAINDNLASKSFIPQKPIALLASVFNSYMDASYWETIWL